MDESVRICAPLSVPAAGPSPSPSAGSLSAWLRGGVPVADREDLLMALNDGTILAITDARGRITYANDRFCEISGYARDELIGQDHRIINSGLHPRSFWAAMYRAVAAGGTWRGEVCNRAKDGRLYWVDTTIRGLLGPDGRLRRMVAMRADITARKLAEQELREATGRLAYDAAHDGLTGLANRAHLHAQVARALDRARSEPAARFAVLYLDLDRFKVVNDSLGHAAGDLLLTIVAGRVAASVGQGGAADGSPGAGVVARLGGDEFGVLLTDLPDATDVAGAAAAVAARVVAAVAEPVLIDGHDVTTTASVGLVAAGPGYAHPDDVLRDADVAMYRAKALGKNRVVAFDAALREAAVARLRLEGDLRRAPDRGELLLHYQPIVSLATGALDGFEALVRWRRDGRLVSPAEFIPVAEDTGLIVPVGAWVLREACRQLAAWAAAHPARPVSMAINVSRRQLADPRFVPLVRAVLAETGADPAAVKLEITESVIMDDTEAARAALAALKACGVRLSMDDFGTGYSSLACLHRFPIDVLKVDRSFIVNLEGRRDAAAVVSAIVGLARNLGMAVVAEGLETPEQVAFLQAVDCDFGQGYYFARPLPAEDAERMLLGETLVLGRPAARPAAGRVVSLPVVRGASAA